MGSSASKLSNEEALNYSTHYNFDLWRIKKLHNRFTQMDADKDSQITRQELILELGDIPLKERVFALLPDKKEKLTFEDFLEILFQAREQKARSQLKLSRPSFAPRDRELTVSQKVMFSLSPILMH
ncbi:hypothetical protein GEMRC1_008014 [Eukaryota sp. GEM-RC1]